ncbi:MAG: glycerol-3-phosphate dehydrogenase [Tardiphaga sp.]|nr:glycerol-3-phosphate dehydrogenase [Tardiphaga sp.]
MRSRDTLVESLTDDTSPDVLIVGGGINGIGVFRDLSLQGVSALLVERGDFCSGTSSAPSRLIHGGLRYLETGEFDLVRESLIERNRLLLDAPHYVKPLRVWVPLKGWSGGIVDAAFRFLRLKRTPGPKGGFVVKLGLMLYDLFGARFRTMPKHRFIGRDDAHAAMPELARSIRIVAEYYDTKITLPERLGLELIRDAEADNPSARAISYMTMDSLADGAVVLRDSISGARHNVRPRVLINCAGAWLDGVDRSLSIEERLIGGTKGSHLVLRHPEFARSLADVMLYFETADHRICLAYALDERHVLLGTTDIRADDPEDTVCSDAEIAYLFDVISEVLPTIPLKRDHIVFAYAGIRPLPLTRGGVAGAISRDHELRQFEATTARPFPTIALVGGKWTTFRSCAEQITDAALVRLGRTRQRTTADRQIGGGVGWPRAAADLDRLLADLAFQHGVSLARLRILVARYGLGARRYLDTLQRRPETMLQSVKDYAREEIAYITISERVERLTDILLRRTSIALLGDAGPDAIAEIAAVAGSAAGWSGIRIAEEIGATCRFLRVRHGINGKADAA